MINTISTQRQLSSHTRQRSNTTRSGHLDEKLTERTNSLQARQRSVEIDSNKEISMTYSSSLTIQTDEDQDKYGLLRGLVANMLKDQGIDFKVANGEEEIDISTISQEEATELIAEDGYFGVDQTSDRIVDFAIGIAGGDPTRLDAIKEGVEDGFKQALEAFNGSLPDISYDTFDAVMNKLDAWAGIEPSIQAS